MSDPFIGQIKIFGGNFAPRGYAFCDGQLLNISQNTALFSLLGTTYGGDGRTTFGLPQLGGRAPIHAGHGPGLSDYRLGQDGGASTVTLAAAQLPSHTHQLAGVAGTSTHTTPSSQTSLAEPAAGGRGGGGAKIYGPAVNIVALAPASISDTGGTGAHANEQPTLALNYIIALVGIYPSRS